MENVQMHQNLCQDCCLFKNKNYEIIFQIYYFALKYFIFVCNFFKHLSLKHKLLFFSTVLVLTDTILLTTIITAVTLNKTWKARLTSSRIHAYQVRSEIEQTNKLLRTTILVKTATSLQTLVNKMFQ